MLINEDIEKEFVRGEFDLVVEKMSRLIFKTDGKIFSISFPFSVRENEENSFSFHWRNNTVLSSELVSLLRGFIENNPNIEEISLDSFYEKASDIERSKEEFWELLKALIFYEDGYFRYEFDPTREDGNLHPLHHFDLFYQTNNTIKIGLHNSIDSDAVIDFMNTSTDCFFLRK